MTSKVCQRCNARKFVRKFSRKTSAADGYSTWCKQCTRTYQRGHRIDQNGKRIAKCRACFKGKPSSEFRKNRAGRRSHWCQECIDTRDLVYCPKRNQYRNHHPPTEGNKRCPKCEETKDVTEYWKCCHRIDGLANWCKDCYKQRDDTDENKLRRRRRMLEKTYGTTLEEVEILLVSQKNRCRCCDKKFKKQTVVSVMSKKNRRGNRVLGGFKVDHCHKTGKIRGLLCNKCNMLIGLAHDNVMILQRTIDYLVEHSAQACASD